MCVTPIQCLITLVLCGNGLFWGCSSKLWKLHILDEYSIFGIVYSHGKVLFGFIAWRSSATLSQLSSQKRIPRVVEVKNAFKGSTKKTRPNESQVHPQNPECILRVPIRIV